MENTTTQVLVVGSGPVGLMLANILNDHGVAILIVTSEVEQRPVEQSRAEGNHARTLALYERLGVLGEAIAQGRPLHGAMLHHRDRTLGHMVLDDPLSYYPGAMILSQARVERILAQRLETSIAVERGWELVGLDQTEQRAVATFRHVHSGETRTVAAQYVVACDGGKSAARKMVGATFGGVSSNIQYALADVEIAFASHELDDNLHIWLNPLMILGRLESKNWKVAAPTDPTQPLPDTPQAVLDTINQRLAQNGVAVNAHSPRWTSVFRISTRQVNKMRFGRIFLAGDAAHIHSPMGGQGMNEGMQDALNLAWKLAAALLHGANDRLLDTYDLERQPIISAVLKDTAEMTRILELPHSSLAPVRNLALAVATNFEPLQPVIREQFAGGKRNYRASPIVDDPNQQAFPDKAPRSGDRAPDAQGIFANGSIQGQRLFSLWQSLHRHELLLFVGDSENETRRAQLTATAHAFEEMYSQKLRARVVTRSGSGTGHFYLDSASDLHQRFGAKKECMYLIRPDGFVAFRADSTKMEVLQAFLASAYGW